MFEQTQATTQKTSEVSHTGYPAVLENYKVANKSNGQSQYVINTGINYENSAYNAFIGVTFGHSTFNVMMKPDKNGTSTFEKPQGNPTLETRAEVGVSGAMDALNAIAQYIEKNNGKKYGSFFGLMRNSNSFVKYVLKHTRSDNAKALASLHSPFTAKGAAKKIRRASDVLNTPAGISVYNSENAIDIGPGDMEESKLPEGANPISWMASKNPFDYISQRFPEAVRSLAEIYDAKRANYFDPCESQVNALHSYFKDKPYAEPIIKSFLGYVRAEGYIEDSTLADIFSTTKDEMYESMKASGHLTESENDNEKRLRMEEAKRRAEEAEKKKYQTIEVVPSGKPSSWWTNSTPSNSSSSSHSSSEPYTPTCADNYNNAVMLDADFRELTSDEEINGTMLSFVNASAESKNSSNLTRHWNRIGRLIKKGKIDQHFIDMAKKHGIFNDNDINYIKMAAESPYNVYDI